MSRLLIWDNHGCLPLREDDQFISQLERYRAAGASVASINVGFAEITWSEHIATLAFMRHWLAQRPDKYRLISTVADVERCHCEGKLGIVFDVEGMGPVEDKPWLVQTFYELGVRWMLIAYNRNNKAGGGCMDEDGGLTDVGRAIIDEMERVGMVLCLSHAGERTVRDALDYVRNPPIFSHANPKGVNAHVRNVSDELMRAVAAKGGVVGLSGIGQFLGVSTGLVERLVRQVCYVVDLVGPDHVGLGLDYVFDQHELAAHVQASPHLYPGDLLNDGRLPMVAPEDLGSVMDGLADTGLSDTHIRGILGENWMRVAERVWK